MYEFSKGLSDTIKGGLLATMGSLLELAPDSCAVGGLGAFDAQWLLQQTGGLVRSKTTPGPLRAGALAGLNSALCIEVIYNPPRDLLQRGSVLPEHVTIQSNSDLRTDNAT